ncbi:MAG TPA: hypothetical protein VL400_15500, partial [Polyangiaceae bacterium]|nr:hypothetical protein [Polyangiaceae bacterium]
MRLTLIRSARRASCFGKTFVASGLALACALAASSEAHAGGLYVTDRGVRPLGRGGAFVAGADDLG